jgi:hypothetical protein
LAQNLKVVVKRDSLWTMMAPIPQDKPVSFILEANAYRAALIEFAKTRGTLAMVPSGPTPKDRASTLAAKQEEVRAAAFLSGEASVSDLDLERIFHLPPPQTPEPPLATEHYTGLKYAGTTIHDRSKMNGAPPQAASGYSFNTPSSKIGGSVFGTVTTKADEKDCPTCGKNGKQ